MPEQNPRPWLLFAAKRGGNYRQLGDLLEFGKLRGRLVNLSMPSWPSLRLRDWLHADIKGLLHVHLTRRRWHRPWLFVPFIQTFYLALVRFSARYRYCVCLHHLRNHSYTAVVLWNGHRMPEVAMRMAAVDCGLPIVYIENGFLPNTRIADPAGVNALNSLPRETTFYRQQPLPVEEQDWQLTARRLNRARNSASVTRATQLPEHYLFAPFQIDDDTQIILHSPWISNMQEYFNVLRRLRERLIQENGQWATLKIVIKEHPTSPWGWEALHERGEQLGVVFANGNSTQELIEKSEGVLTINSSVGIEALLFGKPLIVLGNAFYSLPGLAQHVANEGSLLSAVKALDDWQMDTDLRDRFIHFLATHYCVKKQDYHADNWPALANQVEKAANRTLPWLGD